MSFENSILFTKYVKAKNYAKVFIEHTMRIKF